LAQAILAQERRSIELWLGLNGLPQWSLCLFLSRPARSRWLRRIELRSWRGGPCGGRRRFRTSSPLATWATEHQQRSWQSASAAPAWRPRTRAPAAQHTCSQRGKRLRARVKYGRCGGSVRCDSDQVVVPSPSRSVGARFVGRKPSVEPVSVDFGTTCPFLVHNNIQPQIRLRLFEAGPLGRAAANADIPVTSLLDSVELQVPLEGVGGYSGHLGTVSIAVQSFCFQKAGLKDCLRVLGACQQNSRLRPRARHRRRRRRLPRGKAHQ